MSLLCYEHNVRLSVRVYGPFTGGLLTGVVYIQVPLANTIERAWRRRRLNK